MPSEFLSPGIFQMLAALLVPLFIGQWRNLYMAAIPIVGQTAVAIAGAGYRR